MENVDEGNIELSVEAIEDMELPTADELEQLAVPERERSHTVSLELCENISEVSFQIQRELEGLFKLPRLKAIEHRHKLMGIYKNLEKLYAEIAAGK